MKMENMKCTDLKRQRNDNLERLKRNKNIWSEYDALNGFNSL